MNPVTSSDSAALMAEVTDAERMREVVAQYLIAPDAPPVEVVGCQVEFARRGLSRTLVQYRVTLRDPVGGDEWTKVVGGVVYDGERTRSTWEELRRQPPVPTTAGRRLARVAYVPELDLLLQTFPFDHRLPALERLMTGPMPRLVDPLLASFGPGDWRLDGWDAELARYRVDLRACVQLTVRASEMRTGSSAEARFFAKIYAGEEEAERAWGIQRDVAAALGPEHEPLAVAPLVAYVTKARILVQAEAPGVSLLHLLRTSTSEIAGATEAVRRTARAIAALHRLEVAAPPHRLELGRLDPQRLRRNTDLICAARADLAPVVSEIEVGVLAGLAALGEVPTGPVHGDLKPAHVLFDRDRVVVLDLDKFAAGDAMQDVANMLIHLGPVRMGRKDVKALTTAFVTEYFADASTGWEQRLAPYYAWALLGEAASAAKILARTAARASEDRARLEQRLSFLLEEAQAVLAGGAWLLDPAPTHVPETDEADESVGRFEAYLANPLGEADQRQIGRLARAEERRAKREARAEERRAKRETRTKGP
jgi:hypothetical protein